MIPDSPIGYAVNLSTGIVHKRLALHARGLRRVRKPGQVADLLEDRKPRICRTCWPTSRKGPNPASNGTGPTPE